MNQQQANDPAAEAKMADTQKTTTFTVKTLYECSIQSILDYIRFHESIPLNQLKSMEYLPAEVIIDLFERVTTTYFPLFYSFNYLALILIILFPTFIYYYYCLLVNLFTEIGQANKMVQLCCRRFIILFPHFFRHLLQ